MPSTLPSLVLDLEETPIIMTVVISKDKIVL
jgi:hypothetical protein